MNDCEVLLAVLDEKRPSWWLWCLNSQEDRVFVDGGRLGEVDKERAAAVARRVKLRGYRAVLLCPTDQSREQLSAELTRSAGIDFLVAGRDDNDIRTLLLRPSVQVLRSYFRGELRAADESYTEAVQEFIANDAVCQAFGTALLSSTRSIDDYVPIETDETSRVLEWQLEPSRLLAVTERGLRHLHAADADVALIVNNVRFESDADGHIAMGPAEQEAIASLIEHENFMYSTEQAEAVGMKSQIPQAIELAGQRALGNSVTADIKAMLDTWWDKHTVKAMFDVAQWDQWVWAVFGGQVSLRTRSHERFATPLLIARRDDGEWGFDVVWGPEDPPYEFDTGVEPDISLSLDQAGELRLVNLQSAAVENPWQQQGRRLRLGRLVSADSFRYAYSWQPSTATARSALRIEIEVDE